MIINNISRKVALSALLVSTALTSSVAFAREAAVVDASVVSVAAPRSPAAWAKEKAQGYAQTQVEKQVARHVPDLAKQVRVKVRHALFKTPGVHVEDHKGHNIGVVVADQSHAIRRFFKEVLGVDSEASLPGPAFVGRTVMNLLENYAAKACGDEFEKRAVDFAQKGAHTLLDQAFGLITETAHTKVDLQADVKAEDVAAALQKGAQASDDSDEERKAASQALSMDDTDGFVSKVTSYLQSCLQQFRLWVADQIESAITSAVDSVIIDVADALHNQAVKTTEATTAGLASAASGLVAGPTGLYVAGAALAADRHLESDNDKGYLNRFARWVTGADKKRDDAKRAGQWRAAQFARGLVGKLGLRTDADEQAAKKQVKLVSEGTDSLGADDEFVLVDNPSFKAPSLKKAVTTFTARVNGLRDAAAKAAKASAQAVAEVHDAAGEFMDKMHGMDDVTPSVASTEITQTVDPWEGYEETLLSDAQPEAKKPWFKRVFGN